MRTTLPTAREPDVYGHCGPRSRTPILQAMKSLGRSPKPLRLRSGPVNLRPKPLANGRIASSPKCRNIASFSTSPISPLTSSPLVLSLSRLRIPLGRLYAHLTSSRGVVVEREVLSTSSTSSSPPHRSQTRMCWMTRSCREALCKKLSAAGVCVEWW